MVSRLILILFVALAFSPASRAAETPNDGLLNSGLTVLDGKGARVAADRLADRWKLVLIGYTSCPDVCPFALGSVAMAYRNLASGKADAQMAEPLVVFLTVDPERDRPEEISGYVDHFHPRFVAATGNRKAIDDAVRKLRATYRLNKPDADGFYTVDHSAYLYIVAPDGSVQGRLSPPVRPSALVKAMTRLRSAYDPKE